MRAARSPTSCPLLDVHGCCPPAWPGSARWLPCVPTLPSATRMLLQVNAEYGQRTLEVWRGVAEDFGAGAQVDAQLRARA